MISKIGYFGYFSPETKEKSNLKDQKYPIFEIIFYRNLCALSKFVIGCDMSPNGVDGAGTSKVMGLFNRKNNSSKELISLIILINCIFQCESHSQEHKRISHRSQSQKIQSLSLSLSLRNQNHIRMLQLSITLKPSIHIISGLIYDPTNEAPTTGCTTTRAYLGDKPT